MNEAIAQAYKWHRQTRPTLTAKRALEYARDDDKAGRRRYPSGSHCASVVNPPFKSGSTMLRWIEDPSAIGLRKVGYADELGLRSIRHQGWYTSEDCSETMRGIVYQWPARDRIEQYVYGYEDPNGNGPNGTAAALCFDVTDDKDDAARWADGIAERAADEEREYNAAWQARQEYDELGDSVKETRQSLLRLIRELKAKRTSLCDVSEMVVVMHNAIVRKLDDIREAREKRNELENGFSYHVGWSQG